MRIFGTRLLLQTPVCGERGKRGGEEMERPVSATAALSSSNFFFFLTDRFFYFGIVGGLLLKVW